MTNAELIAALRICGNYADRDGCDEACPYYNDNDCPKRIMCDAADALEAADKRIAELEAQMSKEGEWIDEQRGRWIYAKWCPIKGELVRCRECKRRYKPMDDDLRNEIWCEFIGSTMRKDDFCSYGCADGERKDGEHEL